MADVTTTAKYEVMFPHVREINGQTMMFEPMFSGILDLPEDEATAQCVEKGYLRRICSIAPAIKADVTTTTAPPDADHKWSGAGYVCKECGAIKDTKSGDEGCTPPPAPVDNARRIDAGLPCNCRIPELEGDGQHSPSCDVFKTIPAPRPATVDATEDDLRRVEEALARGDIHVLAASLRAARSERDSYRRILEAIREQRDAARSRIAEVEGELADVTENRFRAWWPKILKAESERDTALAERDVSDKCRLANEAELIKADGIICELRRELAALRPTREDK
jgi:hypothetical protein